MTEFANEDDKNKIDTLLWKAPPGVERQVVAEQDDKWSKESMANEFMANLARSQARGESVDS